jgi:glycosyltransferase involved in cell wall biosynthesis
MNILIVTQYFWPELFRINDLAAGLIERGHKVTVLTGIPNYPEGSYYPQYSCFKPTSEIYQGIQIKRVPIISRGKNNPIKLMLNYLSFVISASVLGPWYCKGTFDIVFVFEPSPITVGIPAIILKKLKRAKLFFWVQDLWPESLEAVNAVRSPKILSLVNRLTQWIYKHCDKILMQCAGFRESILAKGVPENKLKYFPNWAEKVYHPLTKAQSSVSQADFPQGFVVLFAGNLGIAQGLETIVAAADKLRDYVDIHWVILGNGRQKDWLLQQIDEKQLKNTVHYLGQYPTEMMPHYFALADALLVTLKHDPIFAITIPSKIQSYLACGKPIIAALDGFAADLIVEAQAGFVGPAQNATQLADNVLQCYRLSAAEREQLSQHALTYAQQHFNRDKAIDALILSMLAETHNVINKGTEVC